MPAVQESQIALQVSEKAAHASSYWSSDDTKFMMAAPLLFGGKR